MLADQLDLDHGAMIDALHLVKLTLEDIHHNNVELIERSLSIWAEAFVQQTKEKEIAGLLQNASDMDRILQIFNASIGLITRVSSAKRQVPTDDLNGLKETLDTVPRRSYVLLVDGSEYAPLIISKIPSTAMGKSSASSVNAGSKTKCSKSGSLTSGSACILEDDMLHRDAS